MLDPAPKRKRIVSYPTPLIGDVLFYELVHTDRMSIPAYGTSHPDDVRWPNHKLVFIRAKDEVGDHYQFWYAADRDSQDLYNWESGIANVSGMRFDKVVRTYVIPRDDYDPEEIQMGAAMPNVPVNRFPDPVTADGDNTTNDDDPPSYTNHVLAERDQIQIGDKELDSLYVVEKRTYIKRCSITTIQTEDFFGIGGSRVDNLYYRGEEVDGETVETHFDDPTSSYWGWQQDGTQRDGQQLSENWFVISVISSILDAIDAYMLSYPSLTNINLPRRLVSSQLTFNVNSGVGNQDQEGWTFAQGELPLGYSLGLTDSCSSSISISPELGLTFEDRDGSYTPSTVYAFFVEAPVSLSDILSRVGADGLYEPPTTKTAVITLVSASASVRASATAVQSDTVKTNGGSRSQEKTTSTDKSVGQTTQFIQLSGFIGDLDINESHTDDVTATASQNITGTGLSEGFNTVAFVTDTASATASVTTTVGEGGDEIPSGSFITRISVDHYRFGRAKVFVEVVDL